MSSLYFLGNATSYLTLPFDNLLRFGTGDYTIQWYQYQMDTNPFPRIFQMGTYPSTTVGVSIEGGTFYYWTNGSYHIVTNLQNSEYKNQWIHFAISRNSGTTKIFKNGVSIFTMSDTNNFQPVNAMNIGEESNPTNQSAFGGYIYGFGIVAGEGLYTGNFSPSTNIPTLTTGTAVILQNGGSFSGALGSTVVFNNVTPANPGLPSPGGTLNSCFLEGSKILCVENGVETYVPIENLRKGTLVKTRLHGPVPVKLIGTKKFYNPGNYLRSKDRLYVCKKENYPELVEDLVLTGCHSILVDNITESQREQTEYLLGCIYVTDKKYRLIACLDTRTEPYAKEGLSNIWHLALEHEDICANYGIYANGLLVETTSIRMIENFSGMELI